MLKIKAEATTQASEVQVRPQRPKLQVPPTKFPTPPRCLHPTHKRVGLTEIPFLPPKIALSHSSYPPEPSAEETWELKLPLVRPQRRWGTGSPGDADGALTLPPVRPGSPWERLPAPLSSRAGPQQENQDQGRGWDLTPPLPASALSAPTPWQSSYQSPFLEPWFCSRLHPPSLRGPQPSSPQDALFVNTTDYSGVSDPQASSVTKVPWGQAAGAG